MVSEELSEAFGLVGRLIEAEERQPPRYEDGVLNGPVWHVIVDRPAATVVMGPGEGDPKRAWGYGDRERAWGVAEYWANRLKTYVGLRIR